MREVLEKDAKKRRHLEFLTKKLFYKSKVLIQRIEQKKSSFLAEMTKKF
jgi:hypothetical protein